MKQKILNFAVVLLIIMTSITTANAQKTMDVSKFTRMDNDLMARVTKPVRDNDEGKLCALIRIITDLKDIEVRTDALGSVQQEQHKGELWIYVPYGARSISFSHDGYFPLYYQYAIPIEEGVVYQLCITCYDTSTDAANVTTNTQMFVLTHNPDEATVTIDDMEMITENGVFAAMMSKGEHKYKISAPMYEEQEGTFILEEQPIRKNVKLEPLFGTFEIKTQPKDGFNIYINDKLVGKSPYKSGKIEPGSYKIRLEDKDFFPRDTVLRIREGDNISTVIDMKDKLIWDNLLGGRDISFGVHAGYVFPFPTSSTGGDFTGSPVNYSLGDSREDVSYSSQSGFNIGVEGDFRLYKNFYLLTGLDFTYAKYSNKFEEPINNLVVMTTDQLVYRGNQTNSYKEDYTLCALEIPILASYRFVLNKYKSIHLNLGPYISYGLSAKMKLSGSSECVGLVHAKFNNIVNYSSSIGDFSTSYHIDGDFDLFSENMRYEKTTEAGSGLNLNTKSDFEFDSSPLRRFNYGIKAGVVYEIKGFRIGLDYSLQLSNMANQDFWESNRILLFNNQVGTNNMSGYKHRVHQLGIKVGYIFRYNKK